MSDPKIIEIAKQVTEHLAAEGKVIEGGYRALEIMTLGNASLLQKREMRKAFFCGAQHVWASIFALLDPEQEPTEKDMKRMSAIDAELRKFADELKTAAAPHE